MLTVALYWMTQVSCLCLPDGKSYYKKKVNTSRGKMRGCERCPLHYLLIETGLMSIGPLKPPCSQKCYPLKLIFDNQNYIFFSCENNFLMP